jgi:hypothetical protein
VAWRDRGRSGWYSSDLEDIMLVFDGRPELLDELASGPPDLRRFVAAELHRVLANPDFDDALPGFLGGDSVSQGRAILLRTRLEAAGRVGTVPPERP